MSAVYEWTRRWVEVPTRGSAYVAASWTTLELPSPGCFALLAPGGFGKSAEMRRLEESRRDGDRFRRVSVAGLTCLTDLETLVFATDWFRSWRAGSESLELVIDSIDEGILSYHGLAGRLVDRFEELDEARARLVLRVVSRANEFPEVLRAGLDRLWEGAYAELHLQPIGYDDIVSTFAERDGSTREATESVLSARSDLLRLCGHPITLLSLAEEGLKKPTPGRRELFRRSATRLCRPISDRERNRRVQHLRADEETLRIVVERIAAASVLTGRYVVSDRPADDDEFVLQHRLAGTPEPGDPTETPITQEVLGDALGTPFFVPPAVEHDGDGKRWTWGLRPYAEFLASEFLLRRRVETQTLVDLLTAPVEGRVIVRPDRRELASWLADRSEVFERLMEVDPLVLLRAESLTYDAERSRAIVRKLTLMEEHDVPLRRLLDTIEYIEPGALDAAADILRETIDDLAQPHASRLMTLLLSVGGRVHALADTLQARALDSGENEEIRIWSTRALARLAGEDVDGRLLSVVDALGRAENGFEQEMLGRVLSRLGSSGVAAPRVFELVTMPVEPNTLGAYRFYLEYELPRRLVAEDVPAGLDWLERHSARRHDSGYPEELERRIVELAWDWADVDPVRMARVVDVLTQSELLDTLHDVAPENAEHRRAFIAELLRRDDPDAELRLYMFSANASDVASVISRLDALDTADSMYDRCVHFVVVSASVLRLDIDDSRARHPKLDDAVRQRTESGPPSEAERRLQRLHEQRTAERREAEENLRKRIEEQRARLEAGDLTAYWSLSMLSTVNERLQVVEYESRPEHLVGWRDYFDDSLRALMIDRSRDYLDRCEPTTDWIAKREIHRPSMAGYRAMHLLLDHDRRSELEAIDWAKWAPSVVGASLPHYPFKKEPRPTLLGYAFERGYERAREAVLLRLAARTESHHLQHLLIDIEEQLAGPISLDLLTWAKSAELEPSEWGDLFQALFRMAEDARPAVCNAALERLCADDASIPIAAVTLVEAPLADATELRERLRELVGSDEAWATSVLEDAVSRTRSATPKLLERLGTAFTSEVVALLGRRLDAYVTPLGTHYLSVGERLDWLRRELLEELAEAGAVREIADLMRDPTDERASYLVHARDAAVRSTASWLSVEDVLALRGGRIFISYRHADNTTGLVTSLHERLERPPALEVWRDVHGISAGDQLWTTIANEIARAKVVIAVVGPDWATHLDAPDDFVRMELELALARQTKVLVVLLDGAALPEPLPSSLAPIAGRLWERLSAEHRDEDLARIRETVERALSRS